MTKPRITFKAGLWFCVPLDGTGFGCGVGKTPSEALKHLLFSEVVLGR